MKVIEEASCIRVTSAKVTAREDPRLDLYTWQQRCVQMHVEKRKKIKSVYGKIVPDIRCPVTPCGYYVPAKESEIRKPKVRSYNQTIKPLLVRFVDLFLLLYYQC